MPGRWGEGTQRELQGFLQADSQPLPTCVIPAVYILFGDVSSRVFLVKGSIKKDLGIDDLNPKISRCKELVSGCELEALDPYRVMLVHSSAHQECQGPYMT